VTDKSFSKIETIPRAEFLGRIAAQGVSRRSHAAFRCPMCKTVQSIASLTRAGVSEEKAETYIGFSCIGRFTGAGSPRNQPDGEPCNWTLGGLLRLHEMEVVDRGGNAHPFFAVATAEEAQALEATFAGEKVDG